MNGSPFFRRRWIFPMERLMVCFDDGRRVIVKDDNGNVHLNCSRWLFDQCWKRQWFEDCPARVLSGAECPG